MWMKPQMHGELEGIKLERSFRLGFRASNNEAEYETLLAGLRVVKILVEYLRLVNFLRKSFDRVKVTQISRGQNSHAGSLAALASFVEDSIPWIIPMEEVDPPSIERPCYVAATSILGSSWMDPITTFIMDGLLLSN